MSYCLKCLSYPALLVALLLVGFGSPAQATEPPFSPSAVKRLQQRVGEAIVRFSFVFEVDRNGNVERLDGEVSAALIGPRGLLLVPDALVSPQTQLRQMSGMSAAMNFRVQSQAFRARVAGQDYDAVLIARDPELGLAWLRLQDAGPRMPYIDLERQASAEPGNFYLSPARVSSDFGETLQVGWGSVLGSTDTPSQALLVAGPFDLAFNQKAQVIGFVPRDFSGNADTRNAQRYGGMVPQRLIDARRLRQATSQALQQEVEQAAAEAMNTDSNPVNG
ncbi:hypothetical protein [Pseudomarimonas arenosa]|uniref:Uncharacterized protein n=1 Tax=Pseudomarimonas arenosa TaxID=2774145 RepID=A0AAW3ZRI9_9GAMM|nr:hypothetical protein [Pseudomarimonas arenosa]MBD8526856.1 hypothetical protein [Pseudomarimonas arenosa]